MPTAPGFKVPDIAGDQRVGAAAARDFKKWQIILIGQYERKWFGTDVFSRPFYEIKQDLHIRARKPEGWPQKNFAVLRQDAVIVQYSKGLGQKGIDDLPWRAVRVQDPRPSHSYRSRLSCRLAPGANGTNFGVNIGGRNAVGTSARCLFAKTRKRKLDLYLAEDASRFFELIFFNSEENCDRLAICRQHQIILLD